MYNDSFRKRYNTVPIAVSRTVSSKPTYPHIHNEIELLYVVKGHSKIKISDICYDAQAGDLFMVNPLEVHSVSIEQNKPYSHMCICFDCSLVVDKQLAQALLDGCKSVPQYFSAHDLTTIHIAGLFEKLFEAVEHNKDALLFEVSAAISLIFAELIRNNLLRERQTIDKEASFSQKVLVYLEKHYFENITSKMIAEEFHFTQSYFCRAFKKHFGVAFSSYLNLYRILIAKEKLRDVTQSIAAISQECGFCDVAYFTKCFKKSVGMTPLKYRKSQSSYKK